jgi:hypothetical protein
LGCYCWLSITYEAIKYLLLAGTHFQGALLTQPVIRTVFFSVIYRRIEWFSLHAIVAASEWLVTAPPDKKDPAQSASEDQFDLRLTLRFFVVFNFVFGLGLPLISNNSSFIASIPPFLLRVSHFVTAFGLFLLIQKDLAARSRQRNVARQAEMLKWVRPWFASGLVFTGTRLLFPTYRVTNYHFAWASTDALEAGTCLWAAYILFQLIRAFRAAEVQQAALAS